MTTPRSRHTHYKEPAVEPERDSRSGPLFNRPHTNWNGSNLDPDSVRRHYQGLKRAGFRDNTHAKGGMFWTCFSRYMRVYSRENKCALGIRLVTYICYVMCTENNCKFFVTWRQLFLKLWFLTRCIAWKIRERALFKGLNVRGVILWLCASSILYQFYNN